MKTEHAFNRFKDLDGIEWRVIDHLAKDQGKYADYFWKALKYDSSDCLSQPSLSYEERMALVYTGQGEASKYRVFITPYVDDSWQEQGSHAHFYVYNIQPTNHTNAVVNVGIELVVHNKLVNILGDASVFNEDTNPTEMNEDLESTVPYKSRITELLKDVVAALNGINVASVGQFQFNERLSIYDNANLALWNGESFIGYNVVMSTIMSGVSLDTECKY